MQEYAYFCRKKEQMMDKEEKYRLLTEQIRSLIEGERDMVAVMANVAAAIHETMGFFWTGFYRVMPKDASSDGSGQELVLGPFQGPVACMHIPFGRGVCGHIACSSLSRSEIVVPLFSKDGEVTAVLDIDSKELATFDETDRRYLETICRLVDSI